MRVYLRDEHLINELSRLATERGVTITSLITQALAAYVQDACVRDRKTVETWSDDV